MQIVSRPQNKTARPRMTELAVLPVFFALKHKPVSVVGGSDAAAWKAELLAAAGAHVTVVTPEHELSDEMQELLAHGAAQGSIVLHDTDWRDADFSNTALIIGDVEDDEAPALVQKARSVGVPVNVIDKPAFCDFQFGSIVNRSPVVVGISTDGAAPILGQAVRRRIETLLPQTLGVWGAKAREVRDKVMAQLTPGPERRAFWERFVDRAFTTTPDDADHFADQMIADAATASGKVTLVGAGPGDAELLTLKAVRALQAADVILFDDLVAPDVLELARREAKRMLVGKRGYRESCKQEDINAMMISLAKSGKHVVRLKSGDPMIFGRAGEEIAELEAANIPVDIVPGISAGVALASRLGVSLTHRDLAQSVRFTTGHSRKGALPDNLDWSALSDPATTNIFYMSRRTSSQIAKHLLAYGLPKNTPCAVAMNLARSDEMIWRGSIAELLSIEAQFATDAPFLLAVGQVFAQRQVAALPERQLA